MTLPPPTDAAFYAANSRVNPLLRRHYEALRGDGLVAVDLGCGAGTNSAFLAARGFLVRSFDRSPLARAAAHACHGIEVGGEDIRTVRLEREHGLVLVLLNYVLQDLERADGDAVLQRIFKALPAGARALVSVFEERGAMEAADVLRIAALHGLAVIDDDRWDRWDADHGEPHRHAGYDVLLERT